MDSVKNVIDIWKDDPRIHQMINEGFTRRVNEYPQLREHRDFVERNIFGFGERSFLWNWWILVKEMPKEFTFLEIGVFKGQVLSLIKLIADMQNKRVGRWGITPLSTAGGVWESDYEQDITTIHNELGIEKDYTIIKGMSEDINTIQQAQSLKLDLLYIDGGHSYETTQNDISAYSPLIIEGGYLVIDDCANRFNMPWGYFQGIQEVSEAVDATLPPFTKNEEYKHLYSVMHNRVWIKTKLN